MADVRAFRSGNWSDTTSTSPWWNGTAIFAPEAGDVVYSNTFTIAVNTSATTGTITNASASSRVWKDGGTASASVGGSFSLANGVTLTSNISAISSNSSNIVTCSGTNSATIVGNITGNGNPINVVNFSSSGSLTITGNVGGPSHATNYPVNNTGIGSVSITGAVTGGVNNNSTGQITITGSVTASATTVGANNASTGIFTIIGDITASNGAAGFTSSNSGATNRLSGSFFSAANGIAAIYALKFILNTIPTAAKIRHTLNGSDTYVDFFTADNTGIAPAVGDVRAGVVYGSATGTLKVPLPSQVAVGVPTDNTTGTAILTASAIWDTLTSSMTTSGSIGERLKNCQTAEINGQQLAAALSTP